MKCAICGVDVASARSGKLLHTEAVPKGIASHEAVLGVAQPPVMSVDGLVSELLSIDAMLVEARKRLDSALKLLAK